MSAPRGSGRPTLLTPRLRDRVLEGIQAGLPLGAAAEAAGRIGPASSEYYFYVFHIDGKSLPASTTVEGEMKRNGVTLNNFISTQGYNIEEFTIILSVSRTKARLEIIIDSYEPFLLVSDSTYSGYDPTTGSMNFQVYDASGTVTVQSNSSYSLGSGTALTITDSAHGPFTQNTPFILTGVPTSVQSID